VVTPTAILRTMCPISRPRLATGDWRLATGPRDSRLATRDSKMIPEFARIGGGTPAVRRLGLATRGNGRLDPADVLYAIERGVNYLNWCAHRDGMSRAIRSLSPAERSRLVIAAQFSERSAGGFLRELDDFLQELGLDTIDVATFYYVESEDEWGEIAGPGGALEAARRAQVEGRIRLLGITTHQRPLAAERARQGKLDLLMIRYNAAHRGAESDVFPVTAERGTPVIAFTALRWRALLGPTRIDPPAWRHRSRSIAIVSFFPILKFRSCLPRRATAPNWNPTSRCLTIGAS